jgi:hypothetical protein
MIIDEIGGHKIERFSSIDDTPIPRFMNFNRYVMLESGVGSDLQAIDNHDKKIILWAKRGEYEKIIRATQNRNQSMRWVLDGLHPGLMSYAVLIRSIDGNLVYDYSDEACKSMVMKLGKWGATKGLIERAVDAVKKNFEQEIDLGFPGKFNSVQTKELYSKRKKRLVLLLKKMIGEATVQMEEQIERLEEFLYGMINPNSYSGKDGFEAKFIRSYEEMSFILSQHSSRDTKTMTVREYYHAWEVVKRQMKPKPKK